MEEIQLGEYVRNNKGNIGKVIGIFKGHCTAKYHIEFQGTVKVKRQYLSTKTIAKYSKNIIDLIEVEDIVNDYKILNIANLKNSGKKVFTICKSDFKDICRVWGEEDIKTILTKEQYEKNCYRIGE